MDSKKPTPPSKAPPSEMLTPSESFPLITTEMRAQLEVFRKETTERLESEKDQPLSEKAKQDLALLEEAEKK